jgi:hypothetical protein
MPFDFATPRNAVARRDAAPMSEEACAFQQTAFATMEEFRHAHELRLQLREHFLSRPAPQAGPWWVGVD